MLKLIDPLISPPLMGAFMEMGHGDEIVFADANFPAVSQGTRIIYYPGLGIVPILKAALRLFPLDYAVDYSAVLMRPANREEEPPVWERFRALLEGEENGNKPFLFLSKPEFYARSRNAFAVVATGESHKFSNIILRKGIVLSGETGFPPEAGVETPSGGPAG
jgi:L-fucose mutarotase